MGEDDRPARDRHRPRGAFGGHGGAEDRSSRALPRGGGVLRLTARRGLAAAAIAVLVLAGCGGGSDGSAERLTVYVSLPLSGQRAAEGRAITDGARLALERAEGKAGDRRVRAVFLDDTGGGETWRLAAAAANARAAAQDSSAIGFIGDLDSGATRASLPITNQAGIVQVSPGSTAVDLTRRVSAQLTPERYRPEDERNFVRLVPAADRLGGGLPFIPPAELSAPGGFDFPEAYERRYGRPPLPPAAYGYEAMDLLLDAIAAAGDSRGDVRDEVLGTQDRGSIIGTYSFDDSGDIQLSR